MNPRADMTPFVALALRLDRVEDVLDASTDEIGFEVHDTLARDLRDIAGDVEAAARRARTGTPTRRLPLARSISLSRRRTLADRFAAIAADAEVDHLADRVRRLESRLADYGRRLPIHASMAGL